MNPAVFLLHAFHTAHDEEVGFENFPASLYCLLQKVLLQRRVSDVSRVGVSIMAYVM